MARKKKSGTENAPKTTPEAATVENDDVEEEEEDEEVEEEIVYLQVDTGDVIKLKQILDETVAGTFLEDQHALIDGNTRVTKRINLQEDHSLNNIKLSVMIIACIFAATAQFAPLPFPESRYVLGACCVAYFIMSGILQLILTFVDKDAILITKPMTKDGTTEACIKKNPALLTHGLRIRTDIPRYSEFYTVTVEFQNMESTPFVSKTWSVGKFFDAEGMFDEFGLMEEVENLFERFEAAKFDSPSKDKKGNEKLKTN
eukprot:CAMPEP_0184862732 /NCGR_PEP_ID=MMETSP0580-20130426/7446_1 /TAXON_ID=1118495 /ORGANISM="Dactyliosolen fragilissimus" /LENGTH=257 /DNA_ID=CAMNT_0027360703 /DNA_START=29 /DNA_END=802 /DNA_ORIENTATION=+